MALSLPYALQALLYASGEPLSKKRISAVLSIDDAMIAAASTDLRACLFGTGLTLVETDTALELRTAHEAAPIVETFRAADQARDLGKASIEAFAIILYSYGATRGDIDRLRGVNSSAALRALLLRGLIERADHDSDTRRIRFVPTMDALGYVGISQITDAPDWQHWNSVLAAAEMPAETPASNGKASSV